MRKATSTPFATTQMNLEDIMLSDVSHAKVLKLCPTLQLHRLHRL